MSPNLRRRCMHVTHFVLSCAVIALGLGCESVALRDAGGTAADSAAEGSGTLSSVVQVASYGQYSLVARDSKDSPGEWQFAVREGRTVPKDDYTFRWNFGDGQTYQGSAQTYTYTANGKYTINVDAVKPDGTLAFTLSLTIEVNVASNSAPTAVAGADLTTNENDLVQLSAAASSDPDNDVLSFRWTQTSGPAVLLLTPNAAATNFVAPLIDADTVFSFVVRVSDGSLESTDEVRVTALNVVAPVQVGPTANAGTDRSLVEGSLALLDGRGSTGDALAFAWSQLSGPTVSIANANQALASFAAPAVPAGGSAILVFELLVTSGGLSAADELSITVLSSNNGGSDPTDPCLTDRDNDGANDCLDGCPDDPAKTAPGLCGCGLSDADPTCGAGDCLASTTAWQNQALSSPQTGLFELRFNATPSKTNLDGVVAFSKGQGTGFASYAGLIRFNLAGLLDVRNGSAYAADASVFYAANTTYNFRVAIDVPARTYSVFVSPPSQAEVAVAQNFAFRTEQAAVNVIDTLGVWASTGGSHDTCDLMVVAAGGGGTPLVASAGADTSIAAGGSARLAGQASGGTAPYTYKWSPTTGLSSSTTAQPTASPSVTTTYTLTVLDSAGASAGDSVVVQVQAAALAANAGSDATVSAGGSTQLAGSASGGQSPYTYRWSPTTGLSNATVAAPTASPSATTTYTLTVTDGAGATASDSVVLTVASISTNSYFVAKNAANASDTNPGTEAAPWKTLAKAGATAKGGDTVYVKAGTYYETLRPQNSGTAGNLISFKAYPGDECKGTYSKSDCRVIIDGQNTRAPGADLYPRGYVRVEGFDIRNHTAEAVYLQGYYDTTSVGVEIVNNYLHDNAGDAINARNAVNARLENNEIYNNGLTAVAFGGANGCNNLTIRGNSVHHNGKDGLQGSGRTLMVENNVLYDQFHTELHQDAVDCSRLSDAVFRNNSFSDFTQLIYLHNLDGGFSNIQIYGNVFYTDKYFTVRGGETTGVFFDCRFTSATATNIVIHSNTFAWTGYSGLWIYGNASGVTLRDNVFYDSGMDVEATNTNSDYNVFYNSPKPSFERSNSVTMDPQFQNYTRHASWDFRLRSTSPAVDRGDALLGTVVPLPAGFADIAGTARPTGTRSDVGAYEFKP